jgi:hypothetical protein
MTRNLRLWIGVVLFGVSNAPPAALPLVANSDWSSSAKSVANALLFFVAPQLLLLASVLVLGRTNHDRLYDATVRALDRCKPRGDVGPVRYKVGLVLFVLPMSFTCIQAYAPGLISGEGPSRVWVTALAHATFLFSLVVLGGDFWDKLRALFVRDARAVFPESGGAAND